MRGSPQSPSQSSPVRVPLLRRAIRALLEFLCSDRPNTFRLVLVLLVATIGIDLVALRTLYLPTRFYLDAIQIQRIASGRLSALGDESFANVAGIYRALGLQQDPTLAGMLGYLLALLVLGIVLVQARGRLTWLGTAAAVVTIVLSAVYLGTYSKDVFVLPVVALVLCMRRGIVGELIVLVSLVAYAEIFRTYWYLVAGLFVAFRLLTLATRRRWVLLVAPFAVLLILALLMPLVTGHPSDYARTFVNESRAGTNVSTLISPFVELPEPFDSFVNTELVLLTAILPLPLLLRGEVYYLASSLVFLVVWIGFFVGSIKVRVDSRAMRTVTLVVAFVATQALFEPDYGSLLRHLTPLLPLLCLVALAPKGVIGRAETPWPALPAVRLGSQRRRAQ